MATTNNLTAKRTGAPVSDVHATLDQLNKAIRRLNNRVLGNPRLSSGAAGIATTRNPVTYTNDGQFYAAPFAELFRLDNACLTWAVLANGGTAGNIKTTAAITYRINGELYTKGATDDFWDLSGETDTAADEFRGYLLLINAAGAASFAATAEVASSALAYAALAALIPEDKAVVGYFVAGVSTDFNAVGGLAAQGDLGAGIPNEVLENARLTWDLSSETDTATGAFRAYALFVDGGTTSFVAHASDASTAAAALTALRKEILDLLGTTYSSKCLVGVYVAGSATNFDASTLGAQGTFYDGYPEAVRVGELTPIS